MVSAPPPTIPGVQAITWAQRLDHVRLNVTLSTTDASASLEVSTDVDATSKDDAQPAKSTGLVLRLGDARLTVPLSAAVVPDSLRVLATHARGVTFTVDKAVPESWTRLLAQDATLGVPVGTDWDHWVDLSEDEEEAAASTEGWRGVSDEVGDWPLRFSGAQLPGFDPSMMTEGLLGKDTADAALPNDEDAEDAEALPDEA